MPAEAPCVSLTLADLSPADTLMSAVRSLSPAKASTFTEKEPLPVPDAFCRCTQVSFTAAVQEADVLTLTNLVVASSLPKRSSVGFRLRVTSVEPPLSGAWQENSNRAASRI